MNKEFLDGANWKRDTKDKPSVRWINRAINTAGQPTFIDRPDVLTALRDYTPANFYQQYLGQWVIV